MLKLLLAALCFLLTNGDASDEKKEKTISLYNGYDLTNWVVTDFGTQGSVKVENGTLILNMGEGATGITWNGDFEFPKMNYEVSLDAMRVDGNDFFCGMTFPVNNDYLTLIVGGWSGTVVGLSSLDGFDASENETGLSMSFQKKRWYDIRLRVAADSVKVWIDNKKVIDCYTADRDLSIRSEVLLSRPFGLASWYTKAALKDIRLKLLD
ncbi:DUF1080 domain-containing protein [candidate division KSB1 bacterium]|nr:DUF1080 domain-containing protein [candidate division KSB1 bacterium]RQW04275.1 MAG: DUF1080 domain-containing protein [candidate division KSB1 bacterium]